MNKSAFKIYISFMFMASVISILILIINFFGFAFLWSDSNTNLHNRSPKGMLDRVSEALVQTENGLKLTKKDILSPDCWCIVINESGNIIWSENKPKDIPDHYSINDVARMTRWFLNDYPVYVSTEDYGLLVLGTSKNAVGKYNMEYSMEWFETLPQRFIRILIVNLCLGMMLALSIGISLYKRLCVLTKGIDDLRQEKRVHLKEKGIFKELSKNINDTSEAIERKNEALASRDSARSNWISGISHDIRTPLSVIMGCSEAILESDELSEKNKKKAEIITGQSIKIKKLIEDLNLISSLEYDMQPSRKSKVRLCPLIRGIVTDIVNSGLSENFEIELDLRDEKTTVLADESLLGRAIFNLINNSIVHNKDGCKISIKEYTDNLTVYLDIYDNGCGVPTKVIENISGIPKSAHGLGLPMAYRIIHVHGGKLTAVNDNGFKVKIELLKEK